MWLVMSSIQSILNHSNLKEDPYTSLGRLGHGVYGFVDKVEKKSAPGVFYARKTVRISGRDGKWLKEAVDNEGQILRRLDHKHIIRILDIYTYRNDLSIIMLDVADMNMSEYLYEVDTATDGPDRDNKLIVMKSWPGCLIKAIDYLHEKMVKHKDLKPDNILIKNGLVIIADFGISKDLVDEETTATQTLSTQGTPMYWAPEVQATGRRGRATDIFSLGCIFLEVATGFLAPPGSLSSFKSFRETDGSSRYSRCPMKLVQWILYLWGFWLASSYHGTLDDYIRPHFGVQVSQLAFLMLDPNPRTRITSHQLTHLMHCLSYCIIESQSCHDCRTTFPNTNRSVRLHSGFKYLLDLELPVPSESALKPNPDLFNKASDWAAVKRFWLKEPIHWDPVPTLTTHHNHNEPAARTKIANSNSDAEQAPDLTDYSSAQPDAIYSPPPMPLASRARLPADQYNQMRHVTTSANRAEPIAQPGLPEAGVSEKREINPRIVIPGDNPRRWMPIPGAAVRPT